MDGRWRGRVRSVHQLWLYLLRLFRNELCQAVCLPFYRVDIDRLVHVGFVGVTLQTAERLRQKCMPSLVLSNFIHNQRLLSVGRLDQVFRVANRWSFQIAGVC